MITYLDSSVILRRILNQPNQLAEWPAITAGVTSALAEVECLRTLDRLRTERALAEAEIAPRREAVAALLRSVDIVGTTRVVLTRAAQPLPTPLGTLDAIHLATAILWQERMATRLVLASHDRALARAARALGLSVIGDPG